MFKLYRLKNYNFRLIIWLLMISGIGVLLVGSAKASLQSRQLIGGRAPPGSCISPGMPAPR